MSQVPNASESPIFLMDGSAYIYRGFFANRTLQRSDGFPTGSLVVVSRILLRILRQKHPRWFAFVKDGKGKNFRHEVYPEYKANREAMPEELVKQIDPICSMVKALGIHLEISEGCEADDCIASLADRFSRDHKVIIVSGDKDLKQCLGPNVTMWDPGSKQEKIVTEESFRAENGVSPSVWADMQALIGDSVDNIPGVPGIGPKMALQIFAQFPGLELIRDHYNLLPAKFQKKLDGHLEDMFLWRKLTTLSRNECRDLTLDDIAVRPIRIAEARQLAQEFEMVAIRNEMDALASEDARTPRVPVRKAQGAGPDAPSKRTCAGVAPVAGGEAGTADAEEEGIPSRAQAVRSGISLLDFATPSPAPALAEVRALPEAEGAWVALVWPEGMDAQPSLAVCAKEAAGGVTGSVAREFVWKGGMPELAGWAEKAAMLVFADAKGLLGKDSAFCNLVRTRAENGEGLFDLGLAAYLFDPEDGDYSWPRLASLARGTDPEGAMLGPAALAVGLALRSRTRLVRDGLDPLYRTLELPLVPVLADMERQGIAIDRKAFAEFLGEVQADMAKVTEDVYEHAGKPFNMRSSQQLGQVLFTELGLPTVGKTRGGQASTSQDALEKLSGKHPIVDAILRFRKLEKLRSTYLEPLPKLADGSGRIHTTFNQEATATGRLSSSNPNLQNIPVRGPDGKRMRHCFVAGEGKLLVSCDYSQIELRVLAHVSQDQALLDAFRNGEDIHSRTAALIFDIPAEEVTSDQRRNAKTINFGLIYGMGSQKLAREIGLTNAQAKEFIERYFARLTGLKAFYEGVEQQAKKDGYVTTLGGRRRLLPGLSSTSGQVYALARRQAINTVIQGSAADIIKMAMLAVSGDSELERMGAAMVLQIHDELLLEVPAAHAEEAAKRVAALMEAVRPGGVAFSVPLVADAGVGCDWGEAH